MPGTRGDAGESPWLQRLAVDWLSVLADDHRVDAVEGDSEQHPQNGREEEATDDLAYRVGLEEPGRAVPVGCDAGDCFESRL
jgi:hypothetical protein